MGGMTTMTTLCAPACSQVIPVKPQGVWPELLKHDRGHMTEESGVSEAGVFRAPQPNDMTKYVVIYMQSTLLPKQHNKCLETCMMKGTANDKSSGFSSSIGSLHHM